MADLLSPGVQTVEIDASAIVPTVGSSTAFFAGHFDRGPVGTYLLITNEDQLVQYYGKPTNLNYNDWYQAKSFLNYSSSLLLSRAANTNGNGTQVSGLTVTADELIGQTIIGITGLTAGIKVGDMVAFGDAQGVVATPYYVTAVTADVDFTIERPLEQDVLIATDANVYIWTQSTNAIFEAVDVVAAAEAVVNNYEYLKFQTPIGNYDEYLALETSLAFVNSTDSKLKLFSRNPGNWGNNIEVAIATPSAFTGDAAYAFQGVALNDLFEYFPTGTEVGIIVRENGIIVETFTGDFDIAAKDANNKSTYIENVINTKSTYLYAKDNTANTDSIKDYIYSTVSATGVETLGTVITLVMGTDSAIQNDDLINAYALVDNKEYVDVDIVIANELDNAASALSLTNTRLDCICFIGANYSDVVGKKSAIAVNNLVTWRQSGSANINNMYGALFANYAYIYDKYADKNRWVNIAGNAAGLRSQTTTNRASWWASAGLERGVLKQVLKLAFSPSNAQRDLLYKNSLNPVVSFPGQGLLVFGQKSATQKASSSNNICLLEDIAA